MTGFVPDSGEQDPLNPVCIGKKLSFFLYRQTKKTYVEESFFFIPRLGRFIQHYLSKELIAKRAQFNVLGYRTSLSSSTQEGNF